MVVIFKNMSDTIRYSFSKVMQWVLALRHSHFVRNMSIVMSGTAIAQIIGFALTPVISRLFNQEDFGLYGSFNSIMNVIAVAATLQYSQAIMLPKKDDDAANLFAVSLLSVLGICLLTVGFAYIFSDWFLGLMEAPGASWLLWFLPLSVFIAGVNQTFQAWCVRRKAFTKTGSSQIIRAGASGVFQIGAGLLNMGGGGLIGSAVGANGTASFNLVPQIFVTDKRLLRDSISWSKIRSMAVEYRDFPIYSASQNTVNALSQGLPVLLLGHFFGIAVAGAYAFGVRLLRVPMNFVLIALRQVLFQKASETHNHGGRLWPLFLKFTLGLFAIIFFPALLLFIWAPEIFSFVFGSEWHTAGIYARWLVLWIIPVFCNVPSTLFARILRKQKELFFYEIIGLVGRGASLVVGGYFFSAIHTIILFSVVGFVFNIVLIFWIGRLLLKDTEVDLDNFDKV